MNEEITLYTPATGFPDLELKIAYGLARMGIETYDSERTMIKDNGGIPAHGNQRSLWDAGCRFDHPNPEYR